MNRRGMAVLGVIAIVAAVGAIAFFGVAIIGLNQLAGG